ncbi:hypothetical protein HPB48_015986 [Haemaphysalis longicornis]|uniref:ATP-dependent DNA helicase n=1 Tax=Haemaphysalis longicornis TaxID=44386 RepID=A0A9J6GK36_HAELO|nr:hypothetical protein HPB48_015986 [Haemaphysalis longicornis]
MSAPGNAAGNATCNASVNASVSAAERGHNKKIKKKKEQHFLLPQDLVRLIKHASLCAAVRKRQDIMDRDEYYNLMRLTKSEQNELLREIIYRQTTPSAPPLRVFFIGPAGSTTGTATPDNIAYNAFVICASTGKAAVAVGGTTVHLAFKLSRKTTGPNKDGDLSATELNTFRVGFPNVKCVIIDELSTKFTGQTRDEYSLHLCDTETCLDVLDNAQRSRIQPSITTVKKTLLTI